MKISLLQLNIILGDFEKNKQSVERLAAQAMKQHPDVLALPEMWNVGFFPKPIVNYADVDGQATRAFLRALAKKYAVNIVGGSVANQINGNLYNTSYIFDREGNEIACYNKIHLFSPAKEDRTFTAGNKLCTFTLDGKKCAVIICYDLRFCELVRHLALEGMDLLFVPSAWPVERLMHWQILNPARAIENQCFVAAINGVGTFKNFRLGGNSMLIDPWGNMLHQSSMEEAVITAELNFDVLQDIRTNMNVFHDRKPEVY